MRLAKVAAERPHSNNNRAKSTLPSDADRAAGEFDIPRPLRLAMRPSMIAAVNDSPRHAVVAATVRSGHPLDATSATAVSFFVGAAGRVLFLSTPVGRMLSRSD